MARASFDYTVVLYRDRDTHLYVAEVPALSISTYGDTRPEALRKAKEAIQVTVEGLQEIGQPVPQQRLDAVVVRHVKVNV